MTVTKTGLLKDKQGHFFLPQTDASLVTGLSQVATNGSYNTLKDTPDLSKFVTNTTNNLTNYYLKKDTYSKAEIQNLLSTVNTFAYKAVDALPELPSAGTMWKIYLVPSTENPNTRDQYITVENTSGGYSWIKIGNTGLDLSAYATTEQINSALAGKQATLVSGTNIKKLAGQDILGSGDLVQKILVAGKVLCAPASKSFLALVCSGTNPIGLWRAGQGGSDLFLIRNSTGRAFCTSNLNCIEISNYGYWNIHILVGESTVQFSTESISSLNITKEGNVNRFYYIPDGGIPVTDLSDDVQQALSAIGKSTPSFGGFYVSNGPLVYSDGEFIISDNWYTNSYNNAYGLTEGSTYFNFLQMGELFEKANFSENDGNVENILNPFDGWKFPSTEDMEKVIGYKLEDGQDWVILRPGSIVNGEAGVHFAVVEITDFSLANHEHFGGLLVFPDNCVMTGVPLTYWDRQMDAGPTELTRLQLDNYLVQGCVFFPGFAAYGSGDDWLTHPNDLSDVYLLTGTEFNNGPDILVSSGSFNAVFISDFLPSESDNMFGKSAIYTPIRLVKSSSITEELNSKYTKPADGIPASDLNQSVQDTLNNAIQHIKTIGGQSLIGTGDFVKTFDSNSMPEPYLLFNGSGLAIISTDHEDLVALVRFGRDAKLYDFSGSLDFMEVGYDGDFYQAVSGLHEDNIIKVFIFNQFTSSSVNLIDAQDLIFGPNLPYANFYVKPSSGIPSSDMTQAVKNVLNLAGTAYQKPQNGIPITDLSEELQSSLGTPVNAVRYSAQTLTDEQKLQARTNIGAYAKPSGGIPYSDIAAGVIPNTANLETISRKVSSSTGLSSSSTDVQYPSAKCVYNALTNKQDIISSTNQITYECISNPPTIPTIPDKSTNIANDKNNTTKYTCPKAVFDEIHPNVSNISAIPDGGLKPNRLYNISLPTSGNFNFYLSSVTDNITNHWYWTITTGNNLPSYSWPSSINWHGGTPTLETNKYYEVSILNGHGIVVEV